jgi:hypothetical protein
MKENQKSVELEINNVKELDEKLSEAIQNNDNKPTEEEIEEAKGEFEKASKDFAVKSWNIGEEKDASAFLGYLQHYIRTRVFWTQNGWMGVLKMTEELDDAERFLKENPRSFLKLGYQALEFMFYSLQNPGGVGLETAQNFKEENELYSNVFDAIGAQVSSARKELKEIQFLQDKYAAMAQGFYLEVEPESEPEVEAEENAETTAPETDLGVTAE